MTKAKKQAERRKFWQEVIREQERSGKPIRAFCRERRVGEQSFYWWRARLRTAAQPLRFAIVDSAALRAASPGIEIRLESGETLRIAPGADAATLRMVLSALREARA